MVLSGFGTYTGGLGPKIGRGGGGGLRWLVNGMNPKSKPIQCFLVFF